MLHVSHVFRFVACEKSFVLEEFPDINEQLEPENILFACGALKLLENFQLNRLQITMMFGSTRIANN